MSVGNRLVAWVEVRVRWQYTLVAQLSKKMNTYLQSRANMLIHDKELPL